jgi:hypothetical protein
MVLGIVNHDHSAAPPLSVLIVKMISQFCYEEQKAPAIGFSFVCGEVEVTLVRDSSNNIDEPELLRMSCEVMPTSYLPT